jgi:hypothetical protein
LIGLKSLLLFIAHRPRPQRLTTGMQRVSRLPPRQSPHR